MLIGGGSAILLLGSYIWLRDSRRIEEVTKLNNLAVMPGQNVLFTQKKMIP